MKISQLEEKARWVRLEVLKAAAKSGKAHIGGTYSAVELLVALYYGKILNYKVNDIHWKNRDRFILSKGHACTALYAIFYDLGIISKKTYESYGSDGGLGGQLEMTIPGVDFNTGSIGHSVGVCAGMALASKFDRKNFKAFTLIGDSEFYEGSIWEILIFANEFKLNNLIVIVDRNRLMVTDTIDDSGLYRDFEKKVVSFGWSYFEVDGHDIKEIISSLKNAKVQKAPVVIIANTIKGKGVSFMENNIKWHNAALTEEDVSRAYEELKRKA